MLSVLAVALLRHSSSVVDAPPASLAVQTAVQGSTLQQELARVEKAESELLAKVRSGAASVLQQVPAQVSQPTSTESLLGALSRFALMAALFVFAGCKGRKRSSTDATQNEIQRGNFQAVGLCACFSGSQPASCCEALCMPDVLWAETASEKIKLFPWLTFAIACCIALGLNVIAAVTGGFGAIAFCIVRLHSRMQLRNFAKQNTDSAGMDLCHDAVVTCCCFGCAQYQEAEFVEVYEKAAGPLAK